MSDGYRRFTPPRLVEVLGDDGVWRTGLQSAWYWDEGAWWANVTWTVGVGERYDRAVHASRVREPR